MTPNQEPMERDYKSKFVALMDEHDVHVSENLRLFLEKVGALFTHQKALSRAEGAEDERNRLIGKLACIKGVGIKTINKLLEDDTLSLVDEIKNKEGI